MKFIVVLLSLGLLTGCTNEKINISPATINKLSYYRKELPSPDVALILFVKSSGSHLCQLNIVTLYDIYIGEYSKKMSFKQFVEASLNQRLKIDNDLLKNQSAVIFTVDKDITHDFETLSIDRFERKYCDADVGRPKHRVIKSKKYGGDKFKSICYFLFISNYNILFDDYLGIYFAIKP